MADKQQLRERRRLLEKGRKARQAERKAERANRPESYHDLKIKVTSAGGIGGVRFAYKGRPL